MLNKPNKLDTYLKIIKIYKSCKTLEHFIMTLNIEQRFKKQFDLYKRSEENKTFLEDLNRVKAVKRVELGMAPANRYWESKNTTNSKTKGEL